MSEATKAALDDALRAHIADECESQVVVSWVAVTWAIHPEHMGSGREVADGQPHHVTDGLLSAGQRITENIWDAAGEDDK